MDYGGGATGGGYGGGWYGMAGRGRGGMVSMHQVFMYNLTGI